MVWSRGTPPLYGKRPYFFCYFYEGFPNGHVEPQKGGEEQILKGQDQESGVKELGGHFFKDILEMSTNRQSGFLGSGLL